jgi:hypothetical protein
LSGYYAELPEIEPVEDIVIERVLYQDETLYEFPVLGQRIPQVHMDQINLDYYMIRSYEPPTYSNIGPLEVPTDDMITRRISVIETYSPRANNP